MWWGSLWLVASFNDNNGVRTSLDVILHTPLNQLHSNAMWCIIDDNFSKYVSGVILKSGLSTSRWQLTFRPQLLQIACVQHQLHKNCAAAASE